MSNIDTTVRATGSYLVDIDSDNDSTAQAFRVRRHAGTNLVSITEGAQIKIEPPVSSTQSPLLVVNTSGGTVAEITSGGLGNFSGGGIRTKQVTSAPTGGVDGDIVVNSGDGKLYAKVGGVWKAFTGV